MAWRGVACVCGRGGVKGGRREEGGGEGGREGRESRARSGAEQRRAVQSSAEQGGGLVGWCGGVWWCVVVCSVCGMEREGVG